MFHLIGFAAVLGGSWLVLAGARRMYRARGRARGQ